MMDEYYCSECGKYHKTTYQKHKRFATIEPYPEKPFMNKWQNDLWQELSDKVAFLLKTLKKWSHYMDRHVTNWRIDVEFLEMTHNDNA